MADATTKCSADDCDRAKYVKGLCSRHYYHVHVKHRQAPPCEFPGCLNLQRAADTKRKTGRPYCGSHISQLTKYGKMHPIKHRSSRENWSCDFPGCESKISPHIDYCGAHKRQLRAGKELRPLANFGAWTLEKLVARGTPVGDCLVWFCRDGRPVSRRYATVWNQGKHTPVHRLAYQLATGEDISGSPIHHKCANPACFKVEHLERAAHADNVLEMMARKDYEAEIARLKKRIAELEAVIQ